MTEELKPYVISVITTRFSEVYMMATNDSEAMKKGKEYLKAYNDGDPHFRSKEIFSCVSDISGRDDLVKGSVH